MTQTQMCCCFILLGPNGPCYLERTLTRLQFDEMTADLVLKTKGCVEKLLKELKLTKLDIDKVILNGGLTRIPLV